MSKTSDAIGQEAARQASKAATEALMRQKDGAHAYCLAGWIFTGCGVGWLLLSLIPVLCKTPRKEWIWMWVVAAVQLVAGIAFVILSKKSRRFQKWAEKDFANEKKKQARLKEKVKVGKRTLPITYGDILALKILAFMVVALAVILLIGVLQGWVKV